MAIILGAEIGTTIKLFVASVKAPRLKRVALGIFIQYHQCIIGIDLFVANKEPYNKCDRDKR
jgi:Na+/phosphate symporter